MEPIQFDNLYDILSVELGRSVDKVRESIQRNPDEVCEAAARAFGAHNFKYTLIEPISTAEGSMTLIAAGSDLGNKISAIVSRQAKDTEIALGPVILVPEDGMVGHFRKLVLDHLTPALDEYKTEPPPQLKRMFQAVKPSTRVFMDGVLEKAATKCLTGSAGLSLMLQAVRNEGFDLRWRFALNGAYFAMAVMSAVSELADDKEVQPSIERIGRAALLEDFAVMLKPGLYAKDMVRHPARSSQIAATFGFAAPVCELIDSHHRYLIEAGDTAPDPDPTLKPLPTNLPVEARVLVVTNLFVSSLNATVKLGGDIEAIKGLNFLMAEGKVDKRAVVTLTRLYLSHKFALFFEKATEIKTQCPHENVAEPILWNILGERNPQKFICNYKECVHLGSQQTLVSQTIPVKFDDKVVAKIRKGEYYACRFLTLKLADLYKEVAVLNTK